MDFRPTDAQEVLRRAVREFAEGELAPHVMEWDEAQRFPLELLPKLAELGLLGIPVPPEYGGAGMSAVEYCICIEELARVDPTIALSIAAHNGVSAAHILMFGSNRQRTGVLTRLARGETLDAGRIGIAALSVGLAQGAFDTARRYVMGREQFGQPIASFQAIQWEFTEMATRIEAARLLTYRAAYLKDQRRPTTLESSMAKLFSSEVAVRAAEECVQIHGGYGFVKDYPAEKFFRDVKLMTIGEGTSEIQRLVITRQYLKEEESGPAPPAPL